MKESQTLNISLLQTNLFWEDKVKNLDSFSRKLDLISNSTDLIILPEMFTTGFTMNAERLFEEEDGLTLHWLKSKAAEKKAVVTGSYIVKENGKYYNRLIWMQPNGEYLTYNKRHLFTLAKEQDYYESGQKKIFPIVNGWKVLPLICYDLRFPVWSRNIENYDLLIYVANWPERRNSAWKSLLIGRAIENQSYTIGLNRVGFDGNQVYHSGDSCVVDYSGKVIRHSVQLEEIISVQLDFDAQQSFRNRFQFLQDKDDFVIQT